jgi:hypothetical protein
MKPLRKNRVVMMAKGPRKLALLLAVEEVLEVVIEAMLVSSCSLRFLSFDLADDIRVSS